MLYTTYEVARLLNLSIETIQKYCKKLGFKKTGRDYILSDEEFDKVKSIPPSKLGRPRGN